MLDVSEVIDFRSFFTRYFKMAAHERVVSESGIEKVSNIDFRGFESENSPVNDEANCADVKLSDFIRNLPGLPSSNPSLNRSTTDVVSTTSDSGPLEDGSEVNCAAKTGTCDNSTTIEEDAPATLIEHPVTLNTERTVEKNRDKHSSRHKSSRDCRKCSERRKTKRCNVGVQCRIDRHLGKSNAPQSSIPKSLYTSNSVPHWEHHKYASLIKLETYPNGNASFLHMWQEEIDALNLNEREMKELADEFLKVCFFYFLLRFAFIYQQLIFSFSSHLVKMNMVFLIMSCLLCITPQLTCLISWITWLKTTQTSLSKMEFLDEILTLKVPTWFILKIR